MRPIKQAGIDLDQEISVLVLFGYIPPSTETFVGLYSLSENTVLI